MANRLRIICNFVFKLMKWQIILIIIRNGIMTPK